MRALYYLAALIFFCGHGMAQVPERGIMDFRSSNNLKVLFDGDIRPTRVEGLENLSCNLSKTTLTVILPGASPFEFSIDRGDLTVLAGNELTEMNLYGEDQTILQAEELTKAICQATGVSSGGLDEIIAGLGSIPESNKFWAQRCNLGDLGFQITFLPIYYYDHVGANVNIFLRWNRHAGMMKFQDRPIQPPPGYEGVSMTPPPLKASGTPFPPIKAARVTQTWLEKSPEVMVASAAHALTKESYSWLWSLFIGFCVFVIGITYIRNKMKKRDE